MTHLSPDQISGWVVGERDSEVGRHLQNCELCHEDLARLQNGLFAFRQSAHRWAEQPSPFRISAPIRMRVFLESAALIALTSSVALLPLYLDVQEAWREAARVEDSLLLNEVDERLSRSVPRSMEQLLDLMNEEKEGPR